MIARREEHDAVLGPPRFSLRTLFLSITVLGCLFGAMAALGSLWSLMILLFAGLVLAHVFGNAIGTTLRDRSSLPAQLSHADRPSVRPSSAIVNAAPGRLTQRTGLDRITLFIAGAGAGSGGTLGGVGSLVLYPEAGPAAVGLGIVSLAVLGALAGFFSEQLRLRLSCCHARGTWQAAVAVDYSMAPARAARDSIDEATLCRIVAPLADREYLRFARSRRLPPGRRRPRRAAWRFRSLLQ